MKTVVVASMLALAAGTFAALPAAHGQDTTAAAPAGGTQSITIKDPAEYNAYTNAVGQSSPTAKAAAIEAFLTQYPGSPVEKDLLVQLVNAYQQSNDTPKTVDAARRLLKVDPTNLRALTFIVYVEKQQANGNAQQLDDAASLAQKGLASPKPAEMSDADYTKLKGVATPIFESTIAADDAAKNDYKDAITAYQAELKSYTDPAQTQTGPGLLDTYLLGQAYLKLTPPDVVNAIWYLTRAAQFAQGASKDQIEKAAEYWYEKYHDQPANMTALDGYDQIKTLAQANLFPPADYKPVPAPPPPSPADQAHAALVAVNMDASKLSLSDKEFILANGNPTDAASAWDTLKDKTFEVPAKVVSATADQVLMAVSQDAQQSNTADFTVNMKTPLKTLPTQGADIKLVGTFDSYTQGPPSMIILKDGSLPAAAAPVHHHTTRHHS
jgi:hypothetical protein